MTTPPLYRDFQTLDALETAYDIEATVPDFDAYAMDFVARSAAAREQTRCILDVSFGPTGEETYDVFLPAETFEGPRPTLYFIHGGYWKATTSKVWSYLAPSFTALGYVVVVSNYTLCPEVTIPEIVRQHRAAYAHFYQHADEYGVDRDHIVVCGHSAGAHGIAALLVTDWVGDYGVPEVPYVGAVPVSGVYDLRFLPLLAVNAELQLDAQSAEEMSLDDKVPAVLPPLVVVHGLRETPEFERQSVAYAEAVRARGHVVDVYSLERNHFDILEDLADGEGLLAREVKRLAAGSGAPS